MSEVLDPKEETRQLQEELAKNAVRSEQLRGELAEAMAALKSAEGADREPPKARAPEVIEPENVRRMREDVAPPREGPEPAVPEPRAGAGPLPEEEEVREEIEAMPLEEKKKLSWGFSTWGFRVERRKNQIFAGALKLLEKAKIKNKTGNAFIKELRSSFERDAKTAEKKVEEATQGKKRQAENVGRLFGNLIKYGRTVTDMTGLSLVSPLRYVMMAGMAMARGSEAAKEVRLKNEEVQRKTLLDVDQALAEAEKIYKLAQEKTGAETVPAAALKDAYLSEMPADLKKRLENPPAGMGFVEGIFRKDLARSVNKLNKILDGIDQNSSLNEKEKEDAKQKMLKKWEKALGDYDRIIGQMGTVDEAAMWGRYAQTAGKAIVAGATIETIALSIEKLLSAITQSSAALEQATLPADTTHVPVPDTLNTPPVEAGPYSEPTGFLKEATGKGWPKTNIEHGTPWDPFGEKYQQEQLDKLIDIKPHVVGGEIEGGLKFDDTLRVPPEVAEVAAAAEAPAEAAPTTAEVLPGAGHEITTDFSVKLGEGGVPKNLETVFHALSADHMAIPAGDVPIDEQFASKSLNMAANLVRLSEGHGVAGISAEDFAKAISFKDGVLEVKDHAVLNDILEKLKGHSDELWQKGVLQGKGAAITHIDNISKGNWLKIVHAEGLEKGLDAGGGEVGAIMGHDNVTLEQIKDFSDSDLVKQASALAEAKAGGPSVQELADLRAKVISNYEPETQAPLDTKGPEARLGSVIEGIQTKEEITTYVHEIFEQNLSRLFPTQTQAVWDAIGNQPAESIMGQSVTRAGDYYAPFINFMHHLQEVTSLEPKGETMFQAAETNKEYIQRALTFAAEKNLLDKIMV